MQIKKLQLLSPCFCAGANKDAPEIREPSIRGQLRFWIRVLFDEETEYLLFGGIKGKKVGYTQDAVASGVVLRVEDISQEIGSKKIQLCPHSTQNKGSQKAIKAHSSFSLCWRYRLHDRKNDQRKEKFEKVLDAWSLLGSLGARSTRAAGSIWAFGYTPAIEEFELKIAELRLPASVRVVVLDEVQESDLRCICTDTIDGGNISGLPLGRIWPRKTSPLKFKIGSFQEGPRIVAIADNRDERGGNLKAAIDALCNNRKEIGYLLRRSSLN